MHLDRKLSLAVLAVLSAGLMTACGGGGGYGGGNSPPPAGQAPTIVGLADQSLAQDTSTPVLNFTVSDADSDTDSVTLTATTSDESIIPAAGIVLGGSGPSRTLQITPAPEMFGDATVTIRAVDPDGLAAQQAIRITANGVFVSFTATVNDWFALDENADEPALSGFTFTFDADDDPAAFEVLLQ
jgi:hypothetical protein